MKRLQIFTLAMLMSILAVGQTTVNIYGKIVDANTKEPLIGVNIIVEGTEIGATTDLDGKYELQNIAPESYNITASYIGYQNSTRTNVIITSKGNDDLNFELQEGGLELQEVVVRASPFQTKLTTPLSSQNLSPEEIRTYPGGNNDVAKVVQSLPGVSGSIGGFRNDVIIRGGAPNENVYYLDGVEIPNINHFSTQGSAGGPVGLLNVDFIENVELASSAFAAQYDNPLSGVLQFEQRKGNPRERQTNIRVSASETALTTEGPIFKGDRSESKTSYLLSVRRSYLQFLFELIGLPIRPDYWDYQYKINHEINEYNSIYLTGIGSLDQFSVKAPDDFDAEQQSVLDQVPLINQWTTTAGLGWKKRLKNGKGIMTTVASVNILNNDFTRYTDNENETGLVLSNISQETEQKLRYQYTQFVDGWSLTGGLNIIRSIYSNETQDFVFNNAFNTELDFLKYGFFAQASKSMLAGRLDVSFGFRMDDNTFSEEQNTLFKTFSPRAAISYVLDADAKWRLSASVGQYYKISPYTILGYQDESGRFVNRDNPYIGSLHGVAGLSYTLGTYGKLSVEGFYKKYSDYPISIVDGISLANKGGDFSVLGNEAVDPTGEGRSYGLELLYQQKLSKNFYGILAITLFKSEFTNIEGEFLPSVWDSGQLVSFTGGYKFGKNWEVSARYRFAGRTPFPPTDIERSTAAYPILILDYNDLGRQTLAPFNQLDLRIDKKWNFKALALNVYLEFQNALIQENPQPPQFGLDRDEAGKVIQPIRLVEIEAGAAALLPILGFAIDF
ncbi:MAG: TonB-dependent receptor [Bacteroidota bacterium]